MRLPRALSLYYIAGTLGFAVIDWVLAAPIRAAFLARPSQRWVYYAVLIGLGLLCRARPGWAPLVGMLESAANLTLVLLSIMLPVYASTSSVEAGGGAGVPFTSWTFVSVLLSGSVLRGIRPGLVLATALLAFTAGALAGTRCCGGPGHLLRSSFSGRGRPRTAADSVRGGGHALVADIKSSVLQS